MSVATRCVKGVCVCVLPVEGNNYKPLALRHRVLGWVSAFLITAKLLAITLAALVPTEAQLSTITANRIVQLTNAERQKVGLNALTVNSQLRQAASDKATHMLEEDYFAHISPSGVTPWFWIKKHGYAYQVAGENLAIDFQEAEDVVAAWLASPTHKDNMLMDRYLETGVAVATGEFQGGTSTVVVHMFGLPTTAPEPAPSEPQVASESTPTPTPAPVISTAPEPAPDTQPPRTPRILTPATDVVQNSVRLNLEGEPRAEVTVWLNDKEAALGVFDDVGKISLEIDVSDLADGNFVVSATSRDEAGNTSAPSTKISLVKDTLGPQLAVEQVSFILSPITDQPSVVVSVKDTERSVVRINGERRFSTDVSDDNLSVAIVDEFGNLGEEFELSLKPQLAVDSEQTVLDVSSRVAQRVRVITAIVAAIIGLLLSLAIMIQIRIQHPSLIIHSGLVLLLAALLFVF